MEYIEVNNDTFENINSLDEIDNFRLFAKKQKEETNLKQANIGQTKAEKRKIARIEKRIEKAEKKGQSEKVERLQKKEKTIEEEGTPAERLALAPLAPLRPLMLEALKDKGIFVPQDLSMFKLAQLFYNTFIAKNKYEEFHYEDYPSNYDNIVVTTAIVSVVTAIVDFCKTLADKKKKGEPLTKTEDKIAITTQNVQEKLEEKAQSAVNEEVGAKVVSNKNIIIAVAAGIIVLIIILAVAKKGGNIGRPKGR